MNEVRLIGNLTKDVTVVEVGKNNIIKASVCIALNSGLKCNYPLCVAWGDVGKNFADLKKGERVQIFGSITTNNYTNKDGQRVYNTFITVWSYQLVDKNSIETGSSPF